MALTPEKRQRLDSIFQSLQDENTNSFIRQRLTGEEPVAETSKQNRDGFFTRVFEDLKKRGVRLKDIFVKTADGELHPLESGAQAVGQVIATGGDIVGETAVSAFRALPDSIEEAFREAGSSVLNTKVGQQAMQALAGGLESYESWKQEHPRAAADFEAVINIAEIIPFMKARSVGRGALQSVKEGVGSARRKIFGGVKEGVEEGAERGIIGGIADTGSRVIDQAKRGVSRVRKNIDEFAERSTRLREAPAPVRESIEAGIDERFVTKIVNSDEADVKLYKEMLDTADRLVSTEAKDVNFRGHPKEIVGQELNKYADHLIKAKNESRDQINTIVKANAVTKLDLTDEYTAFVDDLGNLGVTVKGDGTLRSTGRIGSTDLKQLELMHSLIRPNKQGEVIRELQQVHRTRQRIFDELNLARERQKPLSTSVTNVGEQYRARLLNKIDANAEGYRAASEQSAKTLTVLSEYARILGFKGKIDDITAKDLKAGEVASRVLGNAADRPETMIRELEDTAVELGYQKQIDIFTAIEVADQIEKVYGITKTRSLGGQVQRAVEQAGGVLSSIGQGKLGQAAGKGVNVLLGRTDDDQIEALKKLIDSLIEQQ